jgi:uncharacterized membrane protein
MKNNKSNKLKQLSWWVFFLINAFFGLYAFYMGTVEVLSLLGMAVDAPDRGTPIIFIFHAFSGSAALIAGPLQFNQHLLVRKRNIHRLLGKLYVGAIWIASIGGLWDAIFFDVSLAAKFAFGSLAVLWFSTTTIAYLSARSRKIKTHREWMIRSFALSFFFVTFSFWVEGLSSTALPAEVAYPLGVFLGWFVNLSVAEIRIRLTRRNSQLNKMLRNLRGNQSNLAGNPAGINE